MPEIRVRTNGIGGTVENADVITGGVGLTAAGTTLNSEALAAAPVITAGQHWPIVFDADAELGLPPEIAWVTAHAAGATSATISRGQETWAGGAAARAHLRDINWAHVMTALDWPGTPGGMGKLDTTSYVTGSDTSYNVTPGGTLVDIDAANLKLDFLAPPTGKVAVSLSGAIIGAASQNVFFGLRDASGAVAGSQELVGYGNTVFARPFYKAQIAGLTPGQAYTWKWAWAASGATQLLHGPTYGQCFMEIEAVNF